MKRIIKRNPLLLGVPIIVSLIFIIVPVLMQDLSSKREHLVSHGHEVRKNIVDISDAGRGLGHAIQMRDFQARDSIDAIDKANARLHREIAEVIKLVHDDPEQTRSCLELLSFIDTTYPRLVNKIPSDLSASGRSRAATITLTTFVAEILQQTEKIDEAQLVILSQRERDAAKFVRISNAALAITGIAATLLFFSLLTRVKRDMARVLSLDEQLLAAKAKAEEANEAKSRFLANVSHEIRTPLGLIIGLMDLLVENSLEPAERALYTCSVQRNGRLLLQVVNDLLDISKIEAGHLKIESQPFDLRTAIDDVLKTVTLRAKEKGLAFNVTWVGSVPRLIAADEIRLRQVLLNIIGNAIKFTPYGHVDVSIEWKNTPDLAAGTLLVTVQDSGVGLSDDQKERIFQPFGQADSGTCRHFGGTGLGLVISRQLCRAMGGDLKLVSSSPSKGSIFSISIAAIAGTDELPSAIQPAFSRHSLTGHNVLLAEDSTDNQMLISRLLRHAGASVEIANNGREAINACTKCRFDVVLMDIQMPEVDGYAATQELRKRGYDGPIVALSAHAMSEDTQRSLEIGCNYHLTKPINRNDLIAIVSQFAEARPGPPSEVTLH